MNVEEWSDFVRLRSCADQKRMTLVMTRVLVQARMMDRTCQVMYNEIRKLQDRLHLEKGNVEVMVRTCDSARRAGNNHLLNLRESQVQSEDLQAEMRADMRGLEDQLAAATEQAGALTVVWPLCKKLRRFNCRRRNESSYCRQLSWLRQPRS